MKRKTSMRMKLHTQLKHKDKLIAAERGSWRNISPTTKNGIGPKINER